MRSEIERVVLMHRIYDMERYIWVGQATAIYGYMVMATSLRDSLS